MGPDYYDFVKNYDRKPQSMTLLRSGIAKQDSFRFKNGAIKDGFDEMEDDDSKSTPGPGAYLSISKSFVKSLKIIPIVIVIWVGLSQIFEKPNGTSLGPG